MKYFILAAIFFIIIVLVVLYFVRKRWAIRKVKCLTDGEKLNYVDAALKPFGFEFDLNCDVVVSKNDCWQREYGYMDLYDSKAPHLNMVFDAEPICFEYEGKEYRIELWKGQYGITTGAEIGVYVRDKDSKNYYRAATDEERLDMSFVLTKKCDLFCRCDKSWWLTGFDVGEFSKPEDLRMDVCICFPTCEMRDAFVESLINNGHSCCQLSICDNTVCFEYCCPKYYKPNCKHHIRKFFAQICNYINCHIYMHFTRFFNRTIDKLTYIKFMVPFLYKFVIRLSIPRRKKKGYKKPHKK